MRYLALFFFSLFLLSSCKVFRSNLMLKTPKDFNYDKLVDSLSQRDYRIAPNDALQYRVFTNNGFNLIDLAKTGNANIRNDLDVIVESDGYVKMPWIGRVKVGGMTIKEAEKMMEREYADAYVDPFVSLRVTNKRVIVFPGVGGGARVVPLANNNTTVMEAIASVGGISEDGKAFKVKLIRNNPDTAGKPLVFLMDLSHIDGLTAAKTKVQANDIIYVEPRYRPVFTFIRELSPVLTLVTTMLILFQFYNLTR